MSVFNLLKKKSQPEPTIVLHVGDRVRLCKGELHDIRDNTKRDPYVSWVAGRVHVGEVGTIATYNEQDALGRPNLCVVWDNVKPKDGWFFGLGCVDGQSYVCDFLEILPKEKKCD